MGLAQSSGAGGPASALADIEESSIFDDKFVSSVKMLAAGKDDSNPATSTLSDMASETTAKVVDWLSEELDRARPPVSSFALLANRRLELMQILGQQVLKQLQEQKEKTHPPPVPPAVAQKQKCDITLLTLRLLIGTPVSDAETVKSYMSILRNLLRDLRPLEWANRLCQHCTPRLSVTCTTFFHEQRQRPLMR